MKEKEATYIMWASLFLSCAKSPKNQRKWRDGLPRRKDAGKKERQTAPTTETPCSYMYVYDDSNITDPF